NTGVHKITEQGIFFIPGSQGQVWSLTKIEGRLFVNHNLGLFELKNDALKLISGVSGSFGLTAIPQSSSYFNTTYNGLRKYTLTEGALLNQPLAEGGGAPVEHVIFEDQNYFWAAHPYKGFYRAQLNNQQQRIENKESYIDYEALAAYKTEIHKLEGEIAFYNAGSWYRYNSISDTLEEFEDLKAYTAYALLSNQDNSYWFKNRNGAGLIYTNFSSDSIFIEEPLLESRIIKNYEKIVKRNDSIYYITLNEGFARLNLAQLQRNNANQNLSTPLLNGIKTNNKALALDQSIEIPFKEAGQIEIAIAAPQLHNPKFFYSLSNGLSGQSNGTLNFQNLQAGSYTLKIWPELNGQRGDQPLNVTFLIKRPWYLSNLMIVVYVLLLFGVIFLVAYINKQKLNKHRRELEERLVKEQERKNQLAERNSLLEEINAKRKELANTTYLAAKRNSSLIDIKNDLEAVKDKGDNQKKVNSIQNKINHIIDAKDNWKVFETTFKEINNDFFQQLLENHPTLSSKDLKLCAYLKMNLSTKEIAPLMAISVRGVEIHRYRLRKKLDLKSGKNLSKYLIKNY
ncbi:MAG: Two component regulator three Y domain-containing protein, partial [Leeuwenhoekiella sp.]|nr:Two component regulator three Y domain-containing protein [Leeuwenhoekiella sp.]